MATLRGLQVPYSPPPGARDFPVLAGAPRPGRLPSPAVGPPALPPLAGGLRLRPPGVSWVAPPSLAFDSLDRCMVLADSPAWSVMPYCPAAGGALCSPWGHFAWFDPSAAGGSPPLFQWVPSGSDALGPSSSYFSVSANALGMAEALNVASLAHAEPLEGDFLGDTRPRVGAGISFPGTVRPSPEDGSGDLPLLAPLMQAASSSSSTRVVGLLVVLEGFASPNPDKAVTGPASWHPAILHPSALFLTAGEPHGPPLWDGLVPFAHSGFATGLITPFGRVDFEGGGGAGAGPPASAAVYSRRFSTWGVPESSPLPSLDLESELGAARFAANPGLFLASQIPADSAVVEFGYAALSDGVAHSESMRVRLRLGEEAYLPLAVPGAADPAVPGVSLEGAGTFVRIRRGVGALGSPIVAASPYFSAMSAAELGALADGAYSLGYEYGGQPQGVEGFPFTGGHAAEYFGLCRLCFFARPTFVASNGRYPVLRVTAILAGGSEDVPLL